MVSTIKKIPLAISGLVLGLTALASLLGSIWSTVGVGILSLAVSIFLVLIVRLVVTGKDLRQELASPVTASSFATSLMAMTLLSAKLALPKSWGMGLWLLSFSTYLVYILVFTTQFAEPRQLKLVYPSWVIVYVGVATVAMTARHFGLEPLGWFALIFATLGYLILMPMIFYRLFKIGLEEAFRPLLVILAAPTSLILLAYLGLAVRPNAPLVLILTILAQFFYLGALVLLPGLIRRGFTPLHAALTFPLVNTAIGLRQSLKLLGTSHFLLRFLEMAELLIGLAVVGYALVGYIGLLISIFQNTSLATGQNLREGK